MKCETGGMCWLAGLPNWAIPQPPQGGKAKPTPAPVPVPVADRPWERPGWCDTEGRCWWGRCADEVFNPEWALAPHADIKEFCSDAMPQHCLPHWAIPQPPHAITTYPTPTENDGTN